MKNSNISIPDQNNILDAARRIAPYVNRTPVLTSETLNKMFGTELYFKCENFQKAGAFKSRGAVNAVFSLTDSELKQGVGTHSSGNHAQALARAAALRSATAYIVMPDNAPKVKINAVKGYGGEIIFCKPTLADRELNLQKLKDQYGLCEIHPYNNYQIIAGQATAAYELLQEMPSLNLLLCPVGGGGLLSGTALSAFYFGNKGIEVIACEPSGADDAFRSFQSGEIVPSENPKTIADGLLTSLGTLTFPIIQKYVNDIVTVSDEGIICAMRLIWERMKIIIEPSSAVPLAAILENKIATGGKRVGVIISGGNIDLDNLPWKSK